MEAFIRNATTKDDNFLFMSHCTDGVFPNDGFRGGSGSAAPLNEISSMSVGLALGWIKGRQKGHTPTEGVKRIKKSTGKAGNEHKERENDNKPRVVVATTIVAVITAIDATLRERKTVMR